MKKLILNKDYKPKVGSRVIKKMSESEFIDKLKDYVKQWGNPEDFIDPNEDVLEAIVDTVSFTEDPTKESDFDNLRDLDFENIVLIGKSDIEFTNGAPYMIFYAGGDWQYPVVFMMYHDGNKFRFYVPTKGNTVRVEQDGDRFPIGEFPGWDPEDEDNDFKIKDDRDGKIHDSDSLYILKEMCKQGLMNVNDPVEYLKAHGEFHEDLDYDLGLCREDFKQTVKVI